MPHPSLPHRRPAALMLSISSLALLTACGGGGESSSNLSGYLPNFAAPAPIDIALLATSFTLPNNLSTLVTNLMALPKYQNTNATIAWLQQNFDPNVPNGALQDPIRTSGAVVAHAAGLTGAGEVIAMSDSNISTSHEALTGRVTIINTSALSDEHGTSVASVAAGNSTNFVGVAPGASILAGDFLSDPNLTQLGQAAIAANAVAWNNSWGYTTLGLDQAGFDGAFNYGAAGEAYLSTLDTYAAQGVVVFSVSNDSLTDATLMDGLPFLRPSLEAGWLAVANGVPTVSGSTVTSVHLLSNSCWQAARWCLVADGSWNAATGGTNDYEFITGSSFAAPQVSGALAILAEAFPTLSPHDLRIRLLASAEDSFFTPDASVELATGFFKGYSVIYGHGFLDIEAALRPIGGTTMALAEGGRISTNAPVLTTGSAFGDALEVSLADTDVAVRDALSAGFVMPGSALTSGARPGSQATSLLLKSMTRNLTAERTAAPSALADPFAAFAAPVMSMAAADGGSTASILMPQAGSDMAGVSLTHVLADGPMKVELGLKLARDNGGLMSLDSAEAAAMASVSLGLTQDLGGGAFMALSGEIGITDLGGSTVLTGADTARFDAVKLTAGQSDVFAKGDRLSVGIGLPVAIASGETVLDLPVTRAGLASFESVEVDLAPEARQVDMEITYQTALRDGLEMKLSLVHSDNFGNRAGETDTAAALALAFRF